MMETFSIKRSGLESPNLIVPMALLIFLISAIIFKNELISIIISVVAFVALIIFSGRTYAKNKHNKQKQPTDTDNQNQG